MSEIRQALRSLSQARWYSGTIVAVMALCMALSTTVFAIVDGVLFKPLPYARPAELYLMTGGYLTKAQRGGISVSPRNVRDWTAAVPGAVSTMLNTGLVAQQFGDVRGWAPIVGRIDAHFFEVMGNQPLVGGFTDADFADESAVLISYGVWQSKLGGRPDVIGQALPTADSLVRGRTYRVAGVLPRGFLFPWFGQSPEILLPLVVSSAEQNDLRARGFTGIVRLPSDRPLSDAQARMDAAAAAEKIDWVPRPNDGSPVFDHANLERLDYQMSRLQRPTFRLAFGAAGVLMLLGCLNISGLMASRALDRRQDISVRRALGGRAADIARLLLMENAIVVAAGAALGVLLSTPLMRLTLLLLPDWGLLKTPAIDVRVIVFAALVGVIAVVIASAWPVWRAVRLPAVPNLNDGQRTSGRGQSLGRFVVIAAQVAIGLTLTLGGALLVGSLVQVWRIDPGYTADRVIILQGRTVSQTRAERDAALDRFEHDLRGVSGVTAVGATQTRFSGGIMMNAFADGATVAVRPGFAEAMGLRLVAGRWLSNEEFATGAPVAVMSSRAAAKVFGSEPALGRQIRGFVNQKPQPFEVVGVVQDAQLGRWDNQGLGQSFAPYSIASDEQTSVSIVVRSDRPDQAMALLLPMVQRRDAPDVRVISAAIGADLLNESVRSRRLNSWLFGGFAASALAIVGVGILGLLAMSSTKRTREIGIRMAMGSTPAQVVRMLLREQVFAVVTGLVAGAIVAAWAQKFVRVYLFKMDGSDPRVWAAAVVVMLAVALIGAAIPSVRASRMDPSRALRGE